jgi:hypothetical protein
MAEIKMPLLKIRSPFSERKLPLPFLKITLKKIRRRRREKRTSADFTLRII